MVHSQICKTIFDKGCTLTNEKTFGIFNLIGIKNIEIIIFIFVSMLLLITAFISNVNKLLLKNDMEFKK